MYAVIQTGGKQYSVSPGDLVRVEKLKGDVGSTVEFDKVVAVADGQGNVAAGSGVSGSVTATIASHGRGKKIRVFKFKRRKMYRRRMGHRQDYTEVRIESIPAQQG